MCTLLIVSMQEMDQYFCKKISFVSMNCLNVELRSGA